MINVEGSITGPDVLPVIKQTAKSYDHLIKKTAIIGISGIKRVALRAVNAIIKTGVTPFADEEKAKEWLVK